MPAGIGPAPLRYAHDMKLTHAESTYLAARDGRERRAADMNDLLMPKAVLDPDETVLEMAIGAERRSYFPLLLVTDRRVLITTDRMIRGWHVVDEVPAPQVTGADYASTMLAGTLSVHARGRDDLVLRTARRDEAEGVVEVIRNLLKLGSQG